MKKIILTIFLLLTITACGTANEKIFVANEESGSISVIDATTLTEIDRISLATTHDDMRVDYSPHNVQAVGKLILITANNAHKGHDDHNSHDSSVDEKHSDSNLAAIKSKIPTGIIAVSAHGDGDGHEEEMSHPDQLIIMDAKSHKIVDRIDTDSEAHLAHVVSDGTFAYITSTNKEVLYKVDLEKKTISYINLPKGSAPHGMRLSEDQNTAAIAGMNGQLLILDLSTKQIKSVNLTGKGVQSAIVGDLAIVSVYDTKQIALYNTKTEELSYVDLPSESKGPIQMYWTPDRKFIYVADQGVYFDQPAGENTYKIDIESKKVIKTIRTGNAPHGIVVSPSGTVYVTNLNGNSVSVINNDEKTSEIEVGLAPNGITHWHI